MRSGIQVSPKRPKVQFRRGIDDAQARAYSQDTPGHCVDQAIGIEGIEMSIEQTRSYDASAAAWFRCFAVSGFVQHRVQAIAREKALVIDGELG